MEISNHEIWKNIAQWRNLIEYLINDKIEQIKSNLKNQNQFHSKKISKSKTFTEASDKKKLHTNKNSDIISRTSAISILQQLAEFFLYYEVSFKKSRELLMIFKNIYMIDKETVFDIELEFTLMKKYNKQSSHKSTKSYRQLSKLIQKSKRKEFAILILCLPYLNKNLIKQLLIINKEGNELMKPFIFKYILMNLQLSYSSRLKIWAQLINFVRFIIIIGILLLRL